jgi:prefoldin subunit 5
VNFTSLTDEELLRFCEAENGHLEAEGELVKRFGSLLDTISDLEKHIALEAETTVPIGERDQAVADAEDRIADLKYRVEELEEEVRTLEARIEELTPEEIGA